MEDVRDFPVDIHEKVRSRPRDDTPPKDDKNGVRGYSCADGSDAKEQLEDTEWDADREREEEWALEEALDAVSFTLALVFFLINSIRAHGICNVLVWKGVSG